MRWTAWLLVLGACGFRVAGAELDASSPGGDASDAAPPADGAMDAPGGGPTACVQRWLTGPTLGAPVALTTVNTGNDEVDPFITVDELRLYVIVDGDVYLASRASTSVAFGAPALDTNFSTGEWDTKVSITADGLTAFVNSSRPSGGDSNIWRGTRTTTGALFTFDQLYLAAVNTSFDQWDPHISGDGLRLYLAPTGGTQHVVVATRAGATQPFAAPVAIPEITSTSVDNDPTLSLDERVIVFASNRTGNRGLWYAVRAERTLPFGAPVELTTLNTPSTSTSDDSPHLSADGCALYFISDRGGDGDVYVSTVM